MPACGQSFNTSTVKLLNYCAPNTKSIGKIKQPDRNDHTVGMQQAWLNIVVVRGYAFCEWKHIWHLPKKHRVESQ